MSWRECSEPGLWSRTSGELGLCTLLPNKTPCYCLSCLPHKPGTTNRQPNSILRSNTNFTLLVSHIFPTHHIYNLFLLNNSKNHVTQRNVYKLSRLIFLVPFFKHLKALWFCDRCSFNNPMMGAGWMNGASFEIRSLAVMAEATITHLFTTGVNSCYLRDSCFSSQGPADRGRSAVLVFRDPGSTLSSGTEYSKVMLKSGGGRGGIFFSLAALGSTLKFFITSSILIFCVF